MIVCYFFLRLELINNLVPSIWSIFLLFITLLSIHIISCMTSSQIYFLVRKSVWIVISLFILLGYKFFNYGNFRLDNMILYLSISIPFLIIGYNHALKQKNLDKIVFPLIILYLLSYAPSIIPYLYSGEYSREALNLTIFKSQENAGLVHLWPFLASLILISWGVFKTSRTQFLVRNGLFLSWAFLLIFIFFSGFMSGIFFLVTSVIFIYIFNLNITKFFKTSLIFILFLFLLYYLLLTYASGPTLAKISAINMFIQSGFLLNEEIINIITSDRWFTTLHSINQFLEKPFFGHGIYLESVSGMLGNVHDFDTAAGGHNFFIDLTAFMGIFSIPIILIYFNLIRQSRKIAKLTAGYNLYTLNLIIYSIFVSVFISNILNHWLLFSAFDNFIFLLAGYVYGQLYLNVKNKRTKQIKNR